MHKHTKTQKILHKKQNKKRKNKSPHRNGLLRFF